ncbi:MAG: ERAP1-like C-terminal domain-containing protein [Bryobacteraceae bacterium]
MVLSIVARNADSATLDRLITAVRASKDPLEKENLFGALGNIADPKGVERVMEFAVGPNAPAGAAPGMLITLSADHPGVTWKFALRHVDRPEFATDSMMRIFLMPVIAGYSSDRTRTADLQAYAADQHILPGARRGVEWAIAKINLNAKFRSDRLPEIDKWLASAMTR